MQCKVILNCKCRRRCPPSTVTAFVRRLIRRREVGITPPQRRTNERTNERTNPKPKVKRRSFVPSFLHRRRRWRSFLPSSSSFLPSFLRCPSVRSFVRSFVRSLAVAVVGGGGGDSFRFPTFDVAVRCPLLVDVCQWSLHVAMHSALLSASFVHPALAAFLYSSFVRACIVRVLALKH